MKGQTSTYVGPLEHLRGKRAMTRLATHGYVVAQFDDPALTRSGRVIEPSEHRFSEPPTDALGYGWHAFPKNDFQPAD